jgi:hypothetical protein
MLIAGAANASQAKAPAVPKRPNLVLITIDTLRADHLGCYGYKAIETPHMDLLAAEGTRMERAYTPVPITLPSHTVMMTGTFPMQTGMHDFSGNVLAAQHPTLAGILKQHGYQTGAVVASAVLDSRFGLNRGFDFYYDHFDFSRLLETNLDAMERATEGAASMICSKLSRTRSMCLCSRKVLTVSLIDVPTISCMRAC